MTYIRLRTPREIGLLLRDARKRAKLGQADLAERIGTSRKWVVDAERGNPGAALGTVLRALDAVGVHVAAAVSTGDASDSRQIIPEAAVDIDAVIENARKRSR